MKSVNLDSPWLLFGYFRYYVQGKVPNRQQTNARKSANGELVYFTNLPLGNPNPENQFQKTAS